MNGYLQCYFDSKGNNLVFKISCDISNPYNIAVANVGLVSDRR